MTDTTEALRAQFEKYVNPAGDMKMHRVSGGGYAGHGLNKSWHDFQAGHAAGVAAERERIANIAADLAADACVAYANGEAMDFRTAVGDAIRAGKVKEPSNG